MKAIISIVALLWGCQGEPETLCDRIGTVWPAFELIENPDTGGSPGTQLSFVVRTGLEPDTAATLLVPQTGLSKIAIADAEGRLWFDNVDVPTGSIELSLVANDACGEFRSVRSTFVWDGGGFPECSLSFEKPAIVRPRYPVAVLNQTHDADELRAGLQWSVTVNKGRADMRATLFVVDLLNQQQAEYSAASPNQKLETFELSFPDGTWSLRAVCTWEAGNVFPTSSSPTFVVDLDAPTCSLTEPLAAVVAGDDIDSNPNNGIQFALAADVPANDVDGEQATFFVNGVAFDTVVDGQVAETIGEFSEMTPPATQEIEMVITDWAGNECRAAQTRQTDLNN